MGNRIKHPLMRLGRGPLPSRNSTGSKRQPVYEEDTDREVNPRVNGETVTWKTNHAAINSSTDPLQKGGPRPPFPSPGRHEWGSSAADQGLLPQRGWGRRSHTALPAAGSAQGRPKGCAVRPPVGLFPARAECEASFQTVERCLQISTKLVFTFLQLDTMEQVRSLGI
ncbi:uncharacterized protein ACIB01_001373 [Guaruba guarouba]